MVGPGVLLRDAEAAKLGLEAVAAAFATGEAGGEHHAVVGQRRRGHAVVGDGGAELVEHDRSGDAVVRGEAQGVAGVIVEPAQDLDVDAASEAVVGEVGLPSLVGLLGLEAHIARARTLVRLGGDESRTVQIAPDRGGRQRHAMVVREMPADRLRSGVVAGFDEPTPQLDDHSDNIERRRPRRVVRPP